MDKLIEALMFILTSYEDNPLPWGTQLPVCLAILSEIENIRKNCAYTGHNACENGKEERDVLCRIVNQLEEHGGRSFKLSSRNINR